MRADDSVVVVRPFVDYYRTNGISPVGQDVSDFARHLQRRESLYRSLGIPPGAVRGNSVIEFCPGSGFNALYTLSLGPVRYLLVDGNATGLRRAAGLFSEHFPDACGYEFTESLVEKSASSERFDLVLCEGAIPYQLDPPQFARRIAGFAGPNGLVVVTTIDPVSFLSEIVRRLIAAKVSSPAHSVERRLSDLRPLFKIDLETLKFRSRPVDDWILDNIIQPFDGSRFFSLADAVTWLGNDGFDIYGSSPSFLCDWRWYKELVGDSRRFNERAIEQYYCNILTLLDHRFEHSAHDSAFGRAILTGSEQVWRHALAADRGEHGALSAGADAIAHVASIVESRAKPTARGLFAAAGYLRSEAADIGDLEPFRALFGRGQQYLSFVRVGNAQSGSVA